MKPEEFDPTDPTFIRDPYPIYDQLRLHVPIFYHEPTGLWFCTRYKDVNTLLRDKRLGRSIDHVMSREEQGVPPDPPEYEPFTRLNAHSMFDMEPPDHTRLRVLVHKAFTPRRVRNLKLRIEALAVELLERVIPAGQMDMLEDFAEPLPVAVIAELLGVPDPDRHRLRPWSRNIVAMYELEPTEEEAQRAIQASQAFSDYLKHLAQRRRQEPGDDLITALAFAEEEGDKLTEDELIATCVLLLNAGHEATVNVIGNGVLALFKHPDQLQMLRAAPELIPTAVEEMMRYDTPLQLFRRWVLEDMFFQGFTFRKGMKVGLMFGAANRDPAQFEDPYCFDVRRADNPHISFGAGIHYCLGAPLARLELEIAFRTLLQRLPNLQLVDSEPRLRGTYVIRGLEELRVAF